MQLKLMLAATLLGAVVANAGVFPYRYESHVLDNGLKVILIQLPSEGLVAYYSVVRTGSRDEVEPGHTGFAHFFEHMMFRGTERYPGPVYDRIMTSLGIDANAYTTDDFTCYHLNLAAADLPRVVELEADRFQNLSYAEREFQTEAGAVYGEYRKSRTSPFFALFEALQDTAFDRHTYKHTTMGFEKDIAAMPEMFAYSRSFFARYYRPENVVLIIAGDFQPAAAMALIRDHYAGWKPGYVAPQVPLEPPQAGERFTEVKFAGRSLPILAMAWKGGRFDPARRETAAAMVIEELAFGETSEVYQDLVLDRQLVQRLGAEFSLNRDPALWGLFATITREEDIATVRKTIEQAVVKLQAAPPDAGRLDDVKKRLRYQLLMGMDTPDRVAGGLARYVALTGGIEAVDQLFETLATLQPEDVQRAAQGYLGNDRRTVAVLKGGGK
ncbi:MAG: pitrilysin family protein [Acidobacteriota bacterium]